MAAGQPIEFSLKIAGAGILLFKPKLQNVLLGLRFLELSVELGLRHQQLLVLQPQLLHPLAQGVQALLAS